VGLPLSLMLGRRGATVSRAFPSWGRRSFRLRFTGVTPARITNEREEVEGEKNAPGQVTVCHSQTPSAELKVFKRPIVTEIYLRHASSDHDIEDTWNLSIVTEIYLCDACSDHEIYIPPTGGGGVAGIHATPPQVS
jgi:hypothetical protein